MKKYDKIKRLGHRATDGILDHGTLVITEKLDGNNFRVKLHDDTGQFMFGSRNVKFAKPGEYNEGKIPDHNQIGSQFENAAEYVQNNVDKDTLAAIEDDHDSKLVLFGENMVKHSLEYDWDNTPQWLLFDIWHVEDEHYLHPDTVRDIADRLGIPAAPIIDTMDVDTFRDEFDPEDPDSFVPDSQYRDGIAEGVVLHNTDNSVKAKIHSDEFKEVHKQDGGKHGQEHLPGDDTAELANKYGTDQRIRKHIQKLVQEEGHDLEMPLMEHLPMRVVEDIFEEEYEEIVRTNKTINFKDFRSRIAKQCVSILRSKMREEATS